MLDEAAAVPGRREAPLVLKAVPPPARVSVGARTLSIRVASNVPATLTLGGRRFTVGRATRSIRIMISPGDGELKLVAGLRAGRLRTSTTVLVPRV